MMRGRLRYRVVGQDDVVGGNTATEVLAELRARWRFADNAGSVADHLERLAGTVERLTGAPVTLAGDTLEERCQAFLARAVDLGLLVPMREVL